ncbi:MAG: hypothetical protein QG599_129 [Pseudomonadota bacterium]|nr:hypothetical protein [Pseudomonadota bacterium]
MNNSEKPCGFLQKIQGINMKTLTFGNGSGFRGWTALAVLSAGLLSGCASYPEADASAEAVEAPNPAPTVQPAAAPVPPPTVQPVAVSVPPPPMAQGYTDKTVNGSYLTTPEYEEALEYEAALDRYLTDPFIVANYLATEQLLRDSQVDMVRYRWLSVAPFTDLDRPGSGAHLGQMIRGQIASRLTQLGYSVTNADYAARDARGFYTNDPTVGVVVGHYAISQDRIFVNARLLDAGASHRVVSAVDYALPLDQTTLGLATGCFRQGQWICRLP